MQPLQIEARLVDYVCGGERLAAIKLGGAMHGSQYPQAGSPGVTDVSEVIVVPVAGRSSNVE